VTGVKFFSLFEGVELRTRILGAVVAFFAALAVVGSMGAAPAGAARPSWGVHSAVVAPAPTPVVQANKLVDTRTGATFVPHGANWPSFEYACSEGWGYSQGGATAAAAAAMQSWGINTVRLPLNENCWLGSDSSDYGTAAGYRSAVAAWVSILNSHGIVVILDLHWTAPPGQHALGQWPMADSQSVTFWSSVALAYSSNPSVIFDLFNEPYSIWNSATDSYTFQLSWTCWESGGCTAPYVDANQEVITGTGSGTYTVVGMAAMVSAVRTAGASQPIMLGGLNYGNDLSGWLAHKPNDSQLIASWHNYPGQLSCSLPTLTACWNSATSAVAASVPIITGEFGETDGGSSYLTEYMNWADSKGIGYLPWAWWDSTGLTGDAADYALYTGSNFTPKAPEGTAYKAHLASLPSTPVLPPAPVYVTLPTPFTFTPLGSATLGSATLGSATTSGASSGATPRVDLGPGLVSTSATVTVSGAQIGAIELDSRRMLRVSSR
jgi:endoglucanase